MSLRISSTPSRPRAWTKRIPLIVTLAVMLAAAPAPALADGTTYAVVQVTSQSDNTCTNGVVLPSSLGQIVTTEMTPTHPAAEPWWQEPNGVWNANSEIYSSWGDATHNFIWEATPGFPGSQADVGCSSDLAHDLVAASTFAGVGVGDYFDVPIPPAGSYTDNFGPGGTNYTMIPAAVAYNGYVVDTGPYTSFAAVRALSIIRPIKLYSVHSQDSTIRIYKNGALVKAGPALLALNAHWRWTPRTHGTYVVKWTSRGVRHSRKLSR